MNNDELYGRKGKLGEDQRYAAKHVSWEKKIA